MGRPTQGVRVMNLRGSDRVSAVALVVESAPEGTNGDAPDGAELTEPEQAARVDGDVSGNGTADTPDAKPKRKASSSKAKPTAKTKPKASKPKRKPAAKKPAAEKKS